MLQRPTLTPEHFSKALKMVSGIPFSSRIVLARHAENHVQKSYKCLLKAIHSKDSFLVDEKLLQLTVTCLHSLVFFTNSLPIISNGQVELYADFTLADAMGKFQEKLKYRQRQKGMGAYASIHETLGWVAEEVYEFELEMAKNASISTWEHSIEELKDVAVACVWGLASRIQASENSEAA